jgi:hypothetical protein
MALALLFTPALVAIVVLAWRWRPRPTRVVAEAAATAPTLTGSVDPLAALDALLADLEGATVRIDGADELTSRPCTSSRSSPRGSRQPPRR